jgi:hypothetical protein
VDPRDKSTDDSERVWNAVQRQSETTELNTFRIAIKDKGADASAPLLHSRDRSDFKADRRFLAIKPVLAQPQNMPKTIAVRKAKETMAASTLSLILNSILASFAGMSRLSGAGCAAPDQ